MSSESSLKENRIDSSQQALNLPRNNDIYQVSKKIISKISFNLYINISYDSLSTGTAAINVARMPQRLKDSEARNTMRRSIPPRQDPSRCSLYTLAILPAQCKRKRPWEALQSAGLNPQVCLDERIPARRAASPGFVGELCCSGTSNPADPFSALGPFIRAPRLATLLCLRPYGAS